MKINYLSIFAALSMMPALFACGGSNTSTDAHHHDNEMHDHEGEHEHEHAAGEIEFSHEQA